MPRTIRARVLLGSVISILVALAVVAAAVPGIATQHEVDVLGARLAPEASLEERRTWTTTVGRDLLYVAVPVRSGDRVVGVSRLALPLWVAHNLERMATASRTSASAPCARSPV